MPDKRFSQTGRALPLLKAPSFDPGKACLATNGDTAGGIAQDNDAKFRFLEGDALSFLKSYPFTGQELVYADPPYVLSTRTGRQYRFEMTDRGAATLLDTIKRLPCMVMISGYWTALYANTLKDWNSTRFQAQTRGGRTATEWLWYNYPEPLALHDYLWRIDYIRSAA